MNSWRSTKRFWAAPQPHRLASPDMEHSVDTSEPSESAWDALANRLRFLALGVFCFGLSVIGVGKGLLHWARWHSWEATDKAVTARAAQVSHATVKGG